MQKQTVVALYARVSTDKQTTDNQILRLNDWAERSGWEVYDRYIDVASGKLARRPAIDRMLSDAKAHYFNLVVAVKLDRLGRSVVNLRSVVEELTGYGVQIKMLDQDIDTTTASGRFMLTILSAVAELERELISERTKDGLARAEKEGKKIGRKKAELSEYQINKAKQILAEDPNISQRKLAEQFDGIGRRQLIECLTTLGLWPVTEKSGSKRGSLGVYKETPKKSSGSETSVCEPQNKE